MISLVEALAFLKFTQQEERDLAKLEATLDSSLIAQFNGAPLRLEFQQPIAPKLAYAVQRRYEEGGSWRVAVQLTAEQSIFMFTPMYMSSGPKKPLSASSVKKPLPAMAKTEIVVAPVSRRLLVRMPTRGRPAQALEVLQRYREMAGCPITIEVVVDHDDQTMLSCEVLQRLNALDCKLTVGHHGSKVAAVNGGDVEDWDILLLASDDMVPVKENYAVRVIEEMERYWPHLDGAIFFDDGFQKGNLCTLPIMGRRFYNQFNYVYHPDYESLYCDLEQTGLWFSLGRLKYVDEKIIEHRHPIWGLAEKDATYIRNDALDSRDREVFERRRVLRNPHSTLPFEAGPIWLSICIVSLPSRKAQLSKLVSYLYDQIEMNGGHFNAEIVIDDRAEPTIGEKRNALLDRAKGLYVAFVDDDDWVAHDYVERIVRALMLEKPDCVALRGVMTTSGVSPEVFDHSIRHHEWATVDGVHLRSPNHLNPIRRELAMQVGFKPISHAEDHDFSTRIRHMLVREAQPGDDPLYFYWFQPAKGAAQ